MFSNASQVNLKGMDAKIFNSLPRFAVFPMGLQSLSEALCECGFRVLMQGNLKEGKFIMNVLLFEKQTA